jgi:hypothetical protein
MATDNVLGIDLNATTGTVLDSVSSEDLATTIGKTMGEEMLSTAQEGKQLVSKVLIDTICANHDLIASLKERLKAPTAELAALRKQLFEEYGISSEAPVLKDFTLLGSSGHSIDIKAPKAMRRLTADGNRAVFYRLSMIDPNLPFELMSFTLPKLDSSLGKDVVDSIAPKAITSVGTMLPHTDSDDSQP